MYIFEYENSVYYLSIDHIVGLCVSQITTSNYVCKITFSENVSKEFTYETKQEAEQLANKICNMKSAMFDARVGKSIK